MIGRWLLCAALLGASAPAFAGPIQIGTAPAPGDKIIVFFDSDYNGLTAEAKQLLEETIKNIKRAKYTSVDLVGHTTAATDPTIQLQLSNIYAKAVAAYLKAHGVAPNRIHVSGAGATDPMIPDTPAKEEPMNRNVVLTITR